MEGGGVDWVKGPGACVSGRPDNLRVYDERPKIKGAGLSWPDQITARRDSLSPHTAFGTKRWFGAF